jgi:outer membrane protein assembly factor BamD
MLRFLLTALLCLPLLTACGSSSKKEETADARPAQEFFDEGNKLMEKDRYTAAAKSFDEIERQHPYSDLAPKAKFLAAHARYLNENYEEAIIAYDQFLQLYPSSAQAPRAMYEKALCYYEQISDVSRDQDMTRRAMELLELVRTRYPQSGEAKEAAIKLDLTRDHLAGKEMEIGRWYQRQSQLQAAISRFRTVVDQYQTTSHVPEALHRLIESYTALGLTAEAKRTAAVLGHNFPGSPWYQDTYRLVADPNTPPADEKKPGWLGRTFKDIF